MTSSKITNLIMQGSEGIPLLIMASDQYDSWLTEQPEQVKNWLTNTDLAARATALSLAQTVQSAK